MQRFQSSKSSAQIKSSSSSSTTVHKINGNLNHIMLYFLTWLKEVRRRSKIQSPRMGKIPLPICDKYIWQFETNIHIKSFLTNIFCKAIQSSKSPLSRRQSKDEKNKTKAKHHSSKTRLQNFICKTNFVEFYPTWVFGPCGLVHIGPNILLQKISLLHGILQ